MNSKTKWLKILTLVAAGVTVVAIILFGLLFFAMAALAPVINPLPVFIVIGLGVTLSAIGIWQAMKGPGQPKTAFQNLFLIVVHGGIVVLLLQPWVVTVEETVLAPEGFTGTVMIVYGAPRGGSLERDQSGSLTYRIPSNGLVLIKDAVPAHRSYRRRYFFEQHNGSLVPITAHWYTTIHETDPDFFAPTIGTYLEGAGEFSPANGHCKIQHQSFVIGTKQFIRSGHRVTEPEMLRRANLTC